MKYILSKLNYIVTAGPVFLFILSFCFTALNVNAAHPAPGELVEMEKVVSPTPEKPSPAPEEPSPTPAEPSPTPKPTGPLVMEDGSTVYSMIC